MSLKYIAYILCFFYLILLYNAINATSQSDSNTSDAGLDIEGLERSLSNTSEQRPIDVIIKPRTQLETVLSLGILAFGLVLVIIVAIIALKRNLGWDQEASRIFVVSIIVTAGLFLITAGYSDDQTAPMFGLLGTIVGYLLSKSTDKEEPGTP